MRTRIRMIERDSFADVAVSEYLGDIVKVNVMRGNLTMADLGRLSESQNLWMPLTETSPPLAVKGGTPTTSFLRQRGSFGMTGLFCWALRMQMTE